LTTELELTNTQANYYWRGQMHCGPPNPNFVWAMPTRSTLQLPHDEAQLLLRMSRSYGIAWNSRAACWRWLFQRWEVWGDRVGVGSWKL